ncbi:MAG: hypothetical protein ACFE8A_10765 [Candidatus Hodarchaeota archaeon]
MVRCYHCGEDLPENAIFRCNDCGQNYCTLHREPINHECNIIKETLRIQQSQALTPTYSEIPSRGYQPQYTSYASEVRGTTDGSFTWHRQESSIPENAFDPDSGIEFKGILYPYKSEFSHLLIGAFLIFLIGFFGFFSPDLIERGYWWSILMLAGFYTTAFLFHEFGHRQVAKHFDLQTKFRLLTFGMMLTILSLSLTIATFAMGLQPLPTFALPGAVVVLGLDKIDRKTGLCKAAGPIINLVYGTILLIISFFIEIYPLNLFIGYAGFLNFSLGLFNMLPIGILDGQNIWKWNKGLYLLLFSLLALLTITTFILISDQTLYLQYLEGYSQ